MKKFWKRALLPVIATFALATTAVSSHAAVVDLTFEGIAPYPSNNDVFVRDAYNGGTSSAGLSGTNYGIGFSDNALVICLNTPGVGCSNTSRGGVGDPQSQLGGLFFLSGDAAIMDVFGGFTTGFSFNYSAISVPGTVTVYDGLGGTGNVLATLGIPTTPSNCGSEFGAGFCPFVPIGVGFDGTAKSVSFAGVENQIVFDDITFGSTTPGMSTVPLPPALPLFSAALLGLAGFMRVRRGPTRLAA